MSDRKMGTVVQNIGRPDRGAVDELGRFGVATIHEAQHRRGLLDVRIRPVQSGVRVAGTAVTVLVPPADNWMLHVAVEQCRDGDILVITPTSPSAAGYFGELLATACRAHGVIGVVIDAGVRDIADLRRMGFPAWSRYVSAMGTVKETLGDVNLPVVCGGQLVVPGDAIVADDDGVVVVPSASVVEVARASRQREEKEAANRQRYAAGELSLDVHGMRERLQAEGLRYVGETPGDVPGGRHL